MYDKIRECVGNLRQKKLAQVVGVAFAIIMIVVASVLLPAKVAYAGECYYGNYFEEVYRSNDWHWRAVAFITRRPIDTRAPRWNPSGPRYAEFWDNSFSESYGRAYIYFSWPKHVNPTSFISSGKFSACMK